MSSGGAFYNEVDKFCVEWLGNLVARGSIAAGRVESRSIRDLRSSDLGGYVQHHFFAGIGVWSRALRLAGWPDDEPVYTGSCPCQPYSSAGRRGGVDDERHLWPEWHRLIRECRPRVIFGEQVASADVVGAVSRDRGAVADGSRRAWLDIVQADLEAEGYAVGAAVLPAAGVGAPHIRHRLFFVAVADGDERGSWWRREEVQGRAVLGREAIESSGRGNVDGLADDDDEGRRLVGRRGLSADGVAPRGHDADGRGEARELGDARRARGGRDAGAAAAAKEERGSERVAARRVGDEPEPAGAARGLGDDDDEGLQGRGGRRDGGGELPPRSSGMAGATRGFWEGAEWVRCRDEKWRPAEPGAFPLSHVSAERVGRGQSRLGRVATRNRVGRLKGYGNAIVAEQAAAFIRAAMRVIGIGGASNAHR